MQDSRVYEQILGIESPWSVERVELELEAGEVHVHLLHHKNATWPCPECGTACPLHEHEPTKTWRHLDTCQYRTLLHASVSWSTDSERPILQHSWTRVIVFELVELAFETTLTVRVLKTR